MPQETTPGVISRYFRSYVLYLKGLNTNLLIDGVNQPAGEMERFSRIGNQVTEEVRIAKCNNYRTHFDEVKDTKSYWKRD